MADVIVGIDSGGTFTDGFFVGRGQSQRAKVDTTPHDLSVCFINCLKEGAKAFGFDELQPFLREVKILRWSTTAATNAFIQRIGARVGVLVTKGFEGKLQHLPEFLISNDLIGTIEEETLDTGEVTVPPEDNNVLEATKRVLDLGARILVVSLHNAHMNPSNERRVREIINTSYPRHYLGSLPVILASQLCNHPDEEGRTNQSILNAYIHPIVSGTLYRAEDQVRELGYPKPLLIIGRDGGCTRVAKTRALDLEGSSPVAGYIGSLFWSKQYNLPNVVTIDIGGTSFDIGVIVNGDIVYSEERRLFDTPVAVPVMDVYSAGLGGGSIIKANLQKKTIEIGPESAGAIPGPACYDLGGENPTVTDSEVVLGRIDPEYFLGGRRRLNAAEARFILQENVASPLGIGVEEVALQVVDKFAAMGAGEIKSAVAKTGKAVTDFVLFAYGGAGATCCCALAQKTGINKIYSFPYASTFGAFGASMMDVMHIQMCSRRLPLTTDGKISLDVGAFNDVVKAAQEKVIRDVTGEGLNTEDITWILELEIIEGDKMGARPMVVSLPKAQLKDITEAETILSSYRQERAKVGLSTELGKNLAIEVFYVKGCCALPKLEFAKSTFGQRDPAAALKTERPVLFDGGALKTKIYRAEPLKCGNVVQGPAIIESTDTSLVLPNDWKFTVDEYFNGLIERLI